MPTVSLELFKKHVRADDFDDDDVYLLHLLEAAETHVITATNRSREELAALAADEAAGETFPVPLKQAVMLIAAHWYNQRESTAGVQMHSVPETLQALIRPYRKLA